VQLQILAGGTKHQDLLKLGYELNRPELPEELGALKIFKFRAGSGAPVERLRREVEILKQNRPNLPRLPRRIPNRLGGCGVIIQFVITNTPLWLLTLSRFQGFQLHIPFFPHEKHIEEFHSNLDGFQSSSKGDFSLFRIKADEMNASVPEITGLEPVMKDYKYCEASILRARVSGVVQYVIMVTSIHSGKGPPSDKKEPEKPIPNAVQPSIYIENMHGSQLISGSPQASIKINRSFNPRDQEFRDLIKEIKDAAPKLGLKDDALKQINADVATIERRSNPPHRSIHTLVKVFIQLEAFSKVLLGMS